jgi:glycerate dehydrogenase
MKVLISERKDALTMLVHRADHLPFDEVVESASVLFITCPHTCETINMIDEPEFAAMRSDAIVINVSRGGVVNENSLVRALQAGKISGAGVDVFDIEPASSPADSVLLSEYSRDLNLVFSPHAAYFSAQTILNMQNKMREHLENWIAGNKIDFVV